MKCYVKSILTKLNTSQRNFFKNIEAFKEFSFKLTDLQPIPQLNLKFLNPYEP